MPSKKPTLQDRPPSQQAYHPRNSSSSDNKSVTQSENVSVCVRVKPIPSSPLSDIDHDTPTPPHRKLSLKDNSSRFGSWLIDPDQSSISLSPSHPIIDRRGTGTSEAVNGSEGYEFKLDQIVDPYSTTSDLYRSNVQSLIETCVKDGYNVTVFAYGQTGSGKTFTMMGTNHDGDEDSLGVIPRAVEQVFGAIASDVDREYLLRVSYLEIYNEALKDLLAADQSHGPTNRLTIHEAIKGRVHVNGIKEEVVTHPMQVLDALARGEKARHVGATDWNERSSRSHTVFTMIVESRPKSTTPTTESSPTQISQLNLIDLAGSESAASSTARRKEGAFINKSLLALSNVISKLSTLEPHIPYRDSKLTRLLQTSLSGNAKVVVICTVSADGRSVVETLSTLRFARRAKMVVTKAERGTILDDKSALLQAYQREIMSLKAQLQENSQALSINTTPGSALAELNAEKSQAESELVSLRFERIRLQEQIEHLNRRILTSQTIQSNVRRAHSLQTPVSPTRRRIVSNQMPQAPKRNKGRVTDIGGMMGMLGIGLSASGYVSHGSRLSEENRAQFQRELLLEKELEQVRSELNQLKQERFESLQDLSQFRTSLLKNQIRALEADKENLPVGITEESQETNAIKVFEDEMDMVSSQPQREIDTNTDDGTDEMEISTQSIATVQTHLNDHKTQTVEQVDSETIDSRVTPVPQIEQQLESLRNEYNQFKRDHSAALQESESQKSNLEAELNSIKKENADFFANSHAGEDLISKLQSEVKNLRMEKEDLIRMQQEQTTRREKQDYDANSKVTDLEVKLSSSKKEHEELSSNQREQISSLEVERSEARQRIEELQSQMTADSASFLTEKQEIALARKLQQQQLQETIEKLENEKAAALVQIQELQTQIETKASHLEKEKEELISNHQDQIDELKSENSDALAQVAELKSRLEGEITSLRKKHENEMSVLKEQLTLIQLEQSPERDQLEELKTTIPSKPNDSNQVQNRDLLLSQQNMANLEVARLQMETKYESMKSTLEAELDAVRKDKDKQLQSQQEEINMLQAECAKAESMLEELKTTTSTESQSLLQEKSDRTSALEGQIEGLQSELSQANVQIQELKTKLENEIESLRQDKEESLSSQKNQFEKLEVGHSEALAKINELTATHDSQQKSGEDREQAIAQLCTQLFEAELSMETVCKKSFRNCEDRINEIGYQVPRLGDEVNEPTDEKAGGSDNMKFESDGEEQLKNLEAELAQLKISLADERAARLNTDIESSQKSETLEKELASLATLQADTSRLKIKLEKLEQRLSLERHKCQEKEFELMQLIQELDQAREKIENLEMGLIDQSNKAQEVVKSVTDEWEGKLNQATKCVDESKSQIVELSKAKGTLEQKSQLFGKEAQRLQVDLEKLRTERTSQEIQQGKLERLCSRLQGDLTRMQEKEVASMEKIELIAGERCAATSSRLHETYNAKLLQLGQSNADLETHIKSLESHLASVGSAQRQQTTAESMETIVDLQSTIDDQNREIRELRSELESIKTSLSAGHLQPIHNNRADHDHYHQSTEDELNRLYHIIDEQEKRLSDAKTDLSKWQARVRSQTEIISKLKITSESDSEQQKFQNDLKRRSNSSLDRTMISTSARNSTTFNNLNCRSPSKLTGFSPLSGRSSSGHLLSSSLSSSSSNAKAEGNNSPRPLPVPQSFISSNEDDDAHRRKHRRRTIEKDMARLKDENVVERKLNSLLYSSQLTGPSNLNIHSDISGTKTKFRTTMPSSPLYRNSISSSSNLHNSKNTSITSSSTNNNRSSLSSTGFKNLGYDRQSGQISPTSSTFSSILSRRGYYE